MEQLQRAVAIAVCNDDALREKIKNDPKGTIEQNFGVTFPEGVNIKAVDEAEKDTLYFILPKHLSEVSGIGLVGEQLSKIAGGSGNVSAILQETLTIAETGIPKVAGLLPEGQLSETIQKDAGLLQQGATFLRGFLGGKEEQ